MSIATIAFLIFIGLSVTVVIIAKIKYDKYWEKVERLYEEQKELRS